MVQFHCLARSQSATQGGDPKTVTYKFVESDVEYSINDGFSATSYTLDLDADSIGQPGYTALKSLTDAQRASREFEDGGAMFADSFSVEILE